MTLDRRFTGEVDIMDKMTNENIEHYKKKTSNNSLREIP